MRRLFHTSWIALVVLLAAALAAFYWLGWTESGLQTLATRLSRRVGPVTMRFEGARGTLAYGLHMDRFVLDHRRVHIEAEDISLSASMAQLFMMNIHVNGDAQAARLLIHVLPNTDEKSDWIPHFLRAPLTIEVPGVRVAKGTLIATNGRVFDTTNVAASGLVRPYAIRVYSGQLHYAGMQLQAEGVVTAATPIGLSGSVRLAASPAGQPAWLANASFNGDLERLPITGAVTQPLAATFTGAASRLNSGLWNWAVTSDLRQLDLRAWGGGNALGVITGTLRVSGDRDGLHATGQLTPPGLKSGPLAVAFDGSYADRVLTARALQFTHRPSGSTLSASGTIGIVAGGPQLALAGRWQNFRWPLTDSAAPVHSQGGEYSLRGLWPYALSASGTLRVLEQPPMDFTASGRLGHEQLTIESAEVGAWGGKATLQGEVAWKPVEAWRLAGQMRGFRLEQFRTAVPGLLAFRFDAEGKGFAAGGSLLARMRDLSGTVRGQRASGQAQVERAGEDWLLSGIRLQLGATRLNADGRLGAHTDLRFDIDASDLALLQEGARGRLQARGSIRDTGGSLPALSLDASGGNIVWQKLALGAVNAKLDFNPQDRGRADAQVLVRSLKYGDRVAESAQFNSSGTAAAHHVTLNVDAQQLQLQASGDAALHDGAWDWSIGELRAEDGHELRLALDAPTQLHIAAGEQVLDRLCLHGTQSHLCGQASNRGGARAMNVSAGNLPLRSLTAGLSDVTEFDGTLGIEAGATAATDGIWLGRLRAQLSSAAVRHRVSRGRTENFNLGTGNVNVDLDARGFSGTAELDAGEAGKISGRATAQTVGDAWQDWPLAGQLQLESDALGLLDSYIPEIDRASGRVTANLGIAGTLAAPQFNGELQVRGALIDAYQVNLAVRDLNLDAKLHDNTLSLDGTASAGVDGKAHFTGNLRWQDRLPYGNLHVTGESLLIVNIPEARIYASPDVELRIAGHRIDITGTVELPYARIEQPDNLANAVRTSGDQAIVSKQQSATADRTQVYSNVTLKLGERVTINTSGLQGRLSGSVTTVSDESGFSRGSGELKVEEGKYTAYARKLDITRGRLIYKDSPMGDPGVDLRAVKQFPDVTAGVNVRGSLTAPTVTFFSDPTIPQSQIVSLLLAGGSLDTVQNASANGSNTARANMLLQGSAILAQQFGNRLATDISVEQNLQNDTSLVLGRYLSPRLYLSYGIGLAEAINTIRMNYTIGDHWTLRTEAGQARSADLVYTIKK